MVYLLISIVHNLVVTNFEMKKGENAEKVNQYKHRYNSPLKLDNHAMEIQISHKKISRKDIKVQNKEEECIMVTQEM